MKCCLYVPHLNDPADRVLYRQDEVRQDAWVIGVSRQEVHSDGKACTAKSSRQLGSHLQHLDGDADIHDA